METIKKFTPMQVGSSRVNDEVRVSLVYGEIRGPYYSEEHPQTEFDTEEEAIEYAYEYDKYSTWLIVPVIRFKNF